MTRPPGEKCAAKAFRGRAGGHRPELRPASPVMKHHRTVKEEYMKIMENQ